MQKGRCKTIVRKCDHPIHLEKLGRIHTGNEASNAVAKAKKAGFININCDIMYGLPQQKVIDAKDDLQKLIDMEPQHISWYQLTIEPNTHFYKQPPLLPVDDTLEEIQLVGMELLAKNHFKQYEVSAFCGDNLQTKHNTNYWQFGDYIGIGAGAHGKLTDINNNCVIRRHKARLPGHYLKTPSYKQSIVGSDELALEFMMNTLRLKQGVPLHYFEDRTGLTLNDIETRLKNLQEKGLLEKNAQTLCTTARGFSFLNSVLNEFC